MIDGDIEAEVYEKTKQFLEFLEKWLTSNILSKNKLSTYFKSVEYDSVLFRSENWKSPNQRIKFVSDEILISKSNKGLPFFNGHLNGQKQSCENIFDFMLRCTVNFLTTAFCNPEIYPWKHNQKLTGVILIKWNAKA